MKTVKLSCPRCQAENHYAVADLQAANGRVQCSQCRHAFTVTRKPKAQSAPAAQAEILQEDVIHAKMPLREKLARLKQQSAALAAQQAAEHNAHSADAIEALLQRSAATPPPPAVLPSIDTLLKSAQSAAAGHGQTQNIHIQAESLVFNLVSGRDPGGIQLPAAAKLPAVIDQPADNLLSAPSGPPNVPASAAAVHSEFNWTLASLAALPVLIMQLFYYLLIMKH